MDIKLHWFVTLAYQCVTSLNWNFSVNSLQCLSVVEFIRRSASFATLCYFRVPSLYVFFATFVWLYCKFYLLLLCCFIVRSLCYFRVTSLYVQFAIIVWLHYTLTLLLSCGFLVYSLCCFVWFHCTSTLLLSWDFLVRPLFYAWQEQNKFFHVCFVPVIRSIYASCGDDGQIRQYFLRRWYEQTFIYLLAYGFLTFIAIVCTGNKRYPRMLLCLNNTDILHIIHCQDRSHIDNNVPGCSLV